MDTHTVKSPFVLYGKMDLIIVLYTYSPCSGPACAISLSAPRILVFEAMWDAFVKRVVYVVQPKSSRNLNAARKPLVVQLWASRYRELYPL
jgi:hypothetical protein